MSTAPSDTLTPDRQPQPDHPPASTGPITRLSPAQARLADYLARGLTIEQVAAETRLSPRTVTKHAAALRIKFRCPARCSMAVLIHALITTGQSTPPPPSRPAPHLSTQQLHLLRALTKHTATRDIAQAAGIEPADVRAHIDNLIVDADTDDPAHLVVLAHGWGLLGSQPSSGNI